MPAISYTFEEYSEIDPRVLTPPELELHEWFQAVHRIQSLEGETIGASYQFQHIIRTPQEYDYDVHIHYIIQRIHVHQWIFHTVVHDERDSCPIRFTDLI